jgi:hypothetical protein
MIPSFDGVERLVARSKPDKIVCPFIEMLLINKIRSRSDDLLPQDHFNLQSTKLILNTGSNKALANGRSPHLRLGGMVQLDKN